MAEKKEKKKMMKKLNHREIELDVNRKHETTKMLKRNFFNRTVRSKRREWKNIKITFQFPAFDVSVDVKWEMFEHDFNSRNTRFGY